MIESVEQLRKDADMCTRMAGGEGGFEMIWMMKRAFLKDLEAVEREVEERYVELPKDMNGVPIHLGDKVRTTLGSTYVVSRITREDYNGTTTWYIEDFASHHSLGSEDLTLCKPPTVEDVLNALCLKYVKSWNGESSKSERREIVAEYAKRLQIREAE